MRAASSASPRPPTVPAVSDPDRGNWQALLFIPGDTVERAGAFEMDCLPKWAIQTAQAAAVAKYGPKDWSRWSMRAEFSMLTREARTVHFVWSDGVLRRCAAPVEVPTVRRRRR
jgi:hypothetical protein